MTADHINNFFLLYLFIGDRSAVDYVTHLIESHGALGGVQSESNLTEID